MSGSARPSSKRTKWLILGGIGAFVLSLFVFFSPMVGLVKHNFTYLPYYGPKEPVLVQRDGKDVVDTIYAEIPPFSFIDRDGQPFTDKDVTGKIIVADFFFTQGDKGIGYYIRTRQQKAAQRPEMFAGTIMATLFGIVMFLIVGWVTNRAIRSWHDSGRKR